MQLPGRGIVEQLAVGARVDEVTATDPEAAAEAIALDQGAELVADETEAAAAVTARRAAAALDVRGIAELRRLADALDRTERIRARTERGVHDGLAQRVARTSGLALHPSSIRDAAAAVVDAEAALAYPTEPIEADPGAGAAGRGRAPRVLAVGVALAVIAWCAALLLALAGAAVPVALAVGAGGSLLALGATRRRRRPPSAALARAPVASREANGARALERTRAEERLRSAQRHWERLVGPRADPHDLDAVLRLHDPQLDFGAADETSPTIRAVSAVERRAAARWRVAWARLGYDDAPARDRVEDELDRLRAGAARPVVVVEPERWRTGGDGLADLLEALPSGTRVTVVRRRPMSDALAS